MSARSWVIDAFIVRRESGDSTNVQGRRALDHEGNLLNVRFMDTCDLAVDRAFFRSVRIITKWSQLHAPSARHSSYPRAIRLELGPTVTHRTARYANNLLEQGHRTVKQRIRPLLGCQRFDSMARFGHAHDEVHNILRCQPVGQRPAPLAWRRRRRHHQLTLLRERRLAA